jgi:DNA-binding MarR family transcriptional regulator
VGDRRQRGREDRLVEHGRQHREDDRGERDRLWTRGCHDSSTFVRWTIRWDTQSSLAEELGITGATLTHHLNALERKGLVRRWREESNRRIQRVELTDEGIELFNRLREVALAHDRRLRSELTDDEAEQLGDLLEKLEAGVRTDVPDP